MDFALKTVIPATAEKIYKAWLSSDGHTKMTGGKAVVSDKVGERFTAWDGYIEGVNIKLEANKRIVQSWRTSQFEDDEQDSQLEIVLNEINGQTEITLIHSLLPQSGAHYQKGWDDHYFQPMKDYFST